MPLGRTLRAGHAFVTAGRLQRLFFALKYFSHRQVAENRHSSVKHSLLYLKVLSPEYAQISGRDCTHLLFQNIQTFYSASEMSFTIFKKNLAVPGLSCSMWDLFQLWQVGSSSSTRDWTQASYTGSTEPRDHPVAGPAKSPCFTNLIIK